MTYRASAVRLSVPVGIGLFPLGIALGILVVQSGLNPLWALGFTAFVYAGSLEFVAVGLVAALTPLPYIALTALLVNFRHVFYALSFPLERVDGRLARFYSVFALTDEAYAMSVTTDRRVLTGRVMVWTQLCLHGYWVSGAVVGAVAGQWILAHLVGLEFGLTALFVVLSIDAIKAQRGWAMPAAAVACGLVGRMISPQHMLPIAMGAFVILLAARYAAADRRALVHA